MATNPIYNYGVEPEPEDVNEPNLESVVNLARKLLRDRETSEKKLARTLASISANRRSSSSSYPEVRRQGWFGKNSEDLRRVDAAKANEDLMVLLGRVAANSGRIITGVHEINATAAEYMDVRDNEVPEHLQAKSRVLSSVLSDLQAQVSVEITTMYNELALRNISRLYNSLTLHSHL
jgi:hypothetical protein